MDWPSLIHSLGVPLVVLGALSYALWQAFIWAAREVVIPVRDKLLTKAIDLLDRLAACLDRHSDLLDRLEENVMRNAEQVTREHERCHSDHCQVIDAINELRDTVQGNKSHNPCRKKDNNQ